MTDPRTPPASQSEALDELTRETEALGLYGGQSDEQADMTANNPKQPEVTEADYKAAHRIAELLEIEGWATGGGYFADHLVQEVAAIRIAARKQALEEAANLCGTLAETTYDDADGFAAATGCEASIRNLIDKETGR